MHRTMHEINKTNGNPSANGHTSEKRESMRKTNVTVCDIGKVSIRPLHNDSQTCKQIRAHIYNSKCNSIGEAQKFMTNVLSSFSPTITENNIKWFTTRIIFDENSLNIKRINLIADLSEEINTNMLTNHLKRVFGCEIGSNTRYHQNKQC